MKNFKRPKTSAIIWNFAAFLLPVLLFLCILYQCGFYPFGEKSMLIMDMKDQYVEFFASLRYALFGDYSLFFSWSRSMGGNYWGILTYYVASPLSFITLFFPVEQLPAAIVILTLLKLGLCGVCFFAYAKYLARRCTGFLSDENKANVFFLILSLCYVFMSYNMVYFLSIMWLDGVILLPLILMGVEKILDGKRGVCYLIPLSLLLISNYYTGYMVGIYTGMYFLFRIFTSISKPTWKDYLKKTLRFTILSLLSIGLAAPVILGALKDLMQGKLAGDGQGFSVDFSQTNFPFTDLFGKLQNGCYDSITNSGLPSIYCGYLVLILALVFLLLRQIKLREKIGILVIAVILGISFYYTSLDTAWHGFQVPNWFPYRYAFLFSFSLLYMACRALTSFPEWKKTIPKIQKPVTILCSFVLLIAVSLDMGINAKSMLDGLDDEFYYGLVSEYDDFIDKTKPLVDDIKDNDEDFYRINQGYEYSKNDAMLLGYNGMTHYSSTFNASINSLTPKLGIAQTYIWNSGYGSNAMLDSLFAVKYILADKTAPSSYIKRMDTEKGSASYENPLALSIGYGSTPTTLAPDLSNYSPFWNQNNYINSIAGTNNSYFTDYAYNVSQNGTEWSYDFVADSDNPVYLYMKAEGTSYADVYVNDVFVGNYFSSETNGTLFLGNFTAGQPVHIRVSSYADQGVSLTYSAIAQLHMEVLNPVLLTLKQNSMQITEHKGGNLSGTVTLEEGQTIMTSIPYDEGWTVYIDGKKVETQQFADTFMVIPCPAGEHEIHLSYTSPGVMTGIIICIISLIISLLYFNLKRLRKIFTGKRQLTSSSI